VQVSRDQVTAPKKRVRLHRKLVAWVGGTLAAAILSIFVGALLAPFPLSEPLSYPGCAFINGVHNSRYGGPKELMDAYQVADELADEAENALNFNSSWIRENQRELQDVPRRYEEDAKNFEERIAYCSSLSLPMTLEEYERLNARQLEVSTEWREIRLGLKPRAWSIEERNQRFFYLDETLDDLNEQIFDFRDAQRAITDCENNQPERPSQSLLDSRLAWLKDDLAKRREADRGLELEFEKLAKRKREHLRKLETRREKREQLPEVCKKFFQPF